MGASRVQRSLTMRGRSFLAAGITTIVGGLILVERDLVRVGVLVSVLPLLAAFYITRRRHQITVDRAVSPPSVAVHQDATVTLHMCVGDRDSAPLLAEDRVPYALGDRPRLDVPALQAESTWAVTYPIRPEVRGQYELGPLRLRVTDPFGLVEAIEEVAGSTRLIATPPVLALPDLDLQGGQYGAGGDTARVYSTGDVSDASIREYRRGDDLRRVHWPSTARVGELMVRREEQPAQSSATVVIDNRLTSFTGTDFEAAVTAAASVVVHLAERGYHCQLATATGLSVLDGSVRRQDVWPMLAALAVLPQTTDDAWSTELEPAGSGVIVAITGRATAVAPAWLVAGAEQRFQRLALAVGGSADLDHLARAGWRATRWAPGTGLAEAWSRLRR